MEMFSQIWEKALVFLEEDLNVYVMKTWIRELKPVKREENDYCFSVEKDLQKKNIDERFLSDIKNAMEEAYEEITGVYNGHINPFVILDKKEKIKNDENLNAEIEEEKERNMSAIPLDPDYTFDNFVVGECNRFANQMAKKVSDNPGQRNSNPLFLYGGPSLGKSHLLHTIGNRIIENNPNAKIVYVSSETFMNEFISMIRMNNKSGKSEVDFREQFQNRYRNIDVLLIDDIQFFSGKEGIQVEFFHTFNSLHNLGKQIVITSDMPPQELEKMDERLLSRFAWGMTADIKPPDYETRVAILMEKAHTISKNDPEMPEIDYEVFHYIASQVTSDIRKLEGALRRMIMYAEFSADRKYTAIDLRLAQTALSDFIESGKVKIVSQEYILDFVAKQFNVKKEDLLGPKRSKDIVYPRMIAQYLMRELCKSTYESIGEFFNNRHHSTVMNAEQSIRKEIDENIETRNMIEDMIERIKE